MICLSKSCATCHHFQPTRRGQKESPCGYWSTTHDTILTNRVFVCEYWKLIDTSDKNNPYKRPKRTMTEWINRLNKMKEHVNNKHWLFKIQRGNA